MTMLSRMSLGALLVFGCGDDGSVAADADDGDHCSSQCDDDEDFFEDTGSEPLQCGDRCSAFEDCVNNRCASRAELPACDGTVRFDGLDVEIPGASDDRYVVAVQSGDLGLGSGDDLVFVYREAIVVVPSDPGSSSVELPPPPELQWSAAAIGEVTGDANPDLVAMTSPSRLVVFAGDGEGGLSQVQELELDPNSVTSLRPLAIGNLGFDGFDEVFAIVGRDIAWLASEGGLLQERGNLGSTAGAFGFRRDPAGTPELWVIDYDHVRVHQGPELEEARLDLPVPMDFAVLEHARVSERSDRAAAILTRYQDRWFVVLADRFDVLHGVEAPTASEWLAAGDVDGDGFDDLVLGHARVVLGLDEGTSDDPFAAACAATIEGLGVRQVVFANRPDDALGVIVWTWGSTPAAYSIEATQ